MPVDKFGRMSDAKTRDTGCHSLISIIIIFDGSTPVSTSIDMNGKSSRCSHKGVC